MNWFLACDARADSSAFSPAGCDPGPAYTELWICASPKKTFEPTCRMSGGLSDDCNNWLSSAGWIWLAEGIVVALIWAARLLPAKARPVMQRDEMKSRRSMEMSLGSRLNDSRRGQRTTNRARSVPMTDNGSERFFQVEGNCLTATDLGTTRWGAEELERRVLEAKPQVAVFDCDGTLWDGDAGLGFMTWSIEQGLVSRSTADWIDTRHREYRSGTVSELQICGEMVQIYAGLREAELRSAAGRYVEEFIAPRVFPELKELIEALKADGVELWAVS